MPGLPPDLDWLRLLLSLKVAAAPTGRWKPQRAQLMSGAATNPDRAIFAISALQVIEDIDATCKLGGENYVLWGGREGYETLLSRCIGPALDPIGRFMNRVVE